MITLPLIPTYTPHIAVDRLTAQDPPIIGSKYISNGIFVILLMFGFDYGWPDFDSCPETIRHKTPLTFNDDVELHCCIVDVL